MPPFNQAPLCGPARHSLATGRYPYEHGVMNNVLLPEEGMRTIAHCLSSQGYDCHCYGHMHWQRLPVERNDVFPDHGYHHYKAMHSQVPEAKIEPCMWEKASMTSCRAAGISCLNSDEFYGYQVARESVADLKNWHKEGRPFLSWTSFPRTASAFLCSERVLRSHRSKPIVIAESNSIGWPGSSVDGAKVEPSCLGAFQ